jgi:glycosyltransferase involved in cell wall biosynthesis
MTTILHISADFPDCLVQAKTRAVETLIGSVGEFRHVVYSLNRMNWPHELAMLPFGPDRTAIAYGAPPYGIALRYRLRPVADAIVADLKQRRVVPGLIHAHKFTVEGLVAADVAEALGCPFIVSIWGDTDIKIFEAKRGLHAHYRDIAGRAEAVLPAAPWTAVYFQGPLGLSDGRVTILPVMTSADAIIPPVMQNAPRLVSVLALDAWQRKGLDTMAAAVADVAHDIPSISLDVYGRGSPKALFAATDVIRKSGAGGRVRLKGPAMHASVQETMNRYAAFIMPTRRETYGMVHVEALLAGVPILWSRDRGVDGLLDGLDIGYRCDPTSREDVARGVRYLIANEVRLKQNLGQLQGGQVLTALRRPAIAALYRSILLRAKGRADTHVSASVSG